MVFDSYRELNKRYEGYQKGILLFFFRDVNSAYDEAYYMRIIKEDKE